jgi:hypothetical protein
MDASPVPVGLWRAAAADAVYPPNAARLGAAQGSGRFPKAENGFRHRLTSRYEFSYRNVLFVSGDDAFIAASA